MKMNRLFQLLFAAIALQLVIAGAAPAAGLEGVDTVTRKPSSIGAVNSALQVYDATGNVDVFAGATRVEQCQCDYEPVAASQTDQVMGGVGAGGDYLQHLLIIPASTSPGAVTVKDGTGASITVFAGGATSVVDLKPFEVPFNASTTGGPWKISTGLNVSAIGFGRFTP